jgi:topoisomerase-4 subunit A
MNTLIKKEILAAAEQYGDERRSKLVVRSEAKALTQKDLVPSEPVTVVVSDKGWARCAKGHDAYQQRQNIRSLLVLSGMY